MDANKHNLLPKIYRIGCGVANDPLEIRNNSNVNQTHYIVVIMGIKDF